MKGFLIGLLSIIIVTALAAGCATKGRTGAVVGGATGAAVGAAVGDTEGAVIGGLLGALAGYGIGRHLEQDDRQEVAYALEKNETGESSTWTNPDTDQTYTVTPTNTYTMSGNPCREFVLVREAGGEEYETSETACRRADGSWEIVG